MITILTSFLHPESLSSLGFSGLSVGSSTGSSVGLSPGLSVGLSTGSSGSSPDKYTLPVSKIHTYFSVISILLFLDLFINFFHE